MVPLFFPVRICFLALAAVYVSLHAAQPSWQSIGLSDRRINGILADDTSFVLAGTATGMSVYWNRAWYDIQTSLPVTAIARLSSDRIAVAMGNGSRADAVYLGRRVLKGPPFYQFAFQHYVLRPTALAVQNTTAIPRLYVGGGNSLAVGQLAEDTLLPLQPLRIPPYSFGVEMPHCATLFMVERQQGMLSNTALLAGGYDNGILKGPGNLLGMVGVLGDSLRSIRRLNVSAIAQGSFFEVGPTELVVGTIDSGIIRVDSLGRNWTVVPTPGSQPVVGLITVPTMLWSDQIVAAFPDGIYTNSGRSDPWTELGDIPQQPTCLAVWGRPSGQLNTTLIAGTEKGVFRYTDRTAGTESPLRTLSPSPAIRICNGVLAVSLPEQTALPAHLAVTSLNGRRMVNLLLFSTVSTAVLHEIGTVIVTVSDRNQAVLKSFLLPVQGQRIKKR
ncbi:MAG: hypothetical protein JXA71_20180 [Chitinispirillaceae bacterium]|nr:hypothetical protein [Chitinispirillaceae bacterium]